MEIGSEYFLEFESLQIQQNNVFHELSAYNTLYLDSGRSAIRLVSHLLKECEVLIPDFMCVSVTNGFESSVLKRYYRVTPDFRIDFEDLEKKITPKTKAIYVMNYFGVLQPKEDLQKLLELRSRYSLFIIEDTTHSILSSVHTVGDYCVCSLRKWFPASEGGVLYSKIDLKDLEKNILPQQPVTKYYGMVLKTLHLRGQMDSQSQYDSIFSRTETALDQQKEVYAMPDLTAFILKCFDVSILRTARKENEQILRERIHNMALVPVFQEIGENCPFMFNVYVRNRDEFREYLKSNGIYAAVHWFMQNTELGIFPHSVWKSEHILSIPVDHRYGSHEMEFIAEIVNSYREGGASKEEFSIPYMAYV